MKIWVWVDEEKEEHLIIETNVRSILEGVEDWFTGLMARGRIKCEINEVGSLSVNGQLYPPESIVWYHPTESKIIMDEKDERMSCFCEFKTHLNEVYEKIMRD